MQVCGCQDAISVQPEGAGLGVENESGEDLISKVPNQDGLLDLIIPYQAPNKGLLRAL